MDPILIKRECGGWIAISPTDEQLKIGVTADSKEEASLAFCASLREWKSGFGTKFKDASANIQPTS